MTRAFAALFGSGATLVLLTLALPSAGDRDELGLVGPALVAYAVTALLLTVPERLPLRVLETLPPVGTLLVTICVYSGGTGGLVAYAMIYFWVALSAFYFFSRASGIANLVLVGVAYGSAQLQVGSSQSAAVQWVMAMGALIVAGVLIGHLRDRVDRLIVRLADLARTDTLTGLTNRRGFEERFDVELERAQRTERPLALLVGDLDFFKELNDRFGHAAGDRALERASAVIGETIRRIDTAARIGGEEFAVLVPEVDHYSSFTLAERLRRAVDDAFRDDGVALTISFGVVAYPKHGSTPGELLRAADQAMYAAKELGRDRTVIYSPEVTATLGSAATKRAAQRAGGLATVLSLAEVLDIRHNGTAAHSQAVGRYAEAMARRLGMDDANAARMRLAGILHDIGKIGVPDAILLKPGPLGPAEWVDMRRHPEIGAQILRNSSLEDIAAWVLAHHERPDGTGYPHGLRGPEIPLEARILAVADAYEAMTADRVYSAALSAEEARIELAHGAGTQFDTDVVDAFLELELAPARARAA